MKRLPKKPTPPRFGRKLTAAQKERATHICLDCGYVYCDQCAPAPPIHIRLHNHNQRLILSYWFVVMTLSLVCGALLPA